MEAKFNVEVNGKIEKMTIKELMSEDYKELTELENKVLRAIKSDCFYQESENGVCWVFTDQFAKDAGISIESCRAILGTLTEKKVIHIDKMTAKDREFGERNNILQVSEDYR
jgi:hypothetical protein